MQYFPSKHSVYMNAVCTSSIYAYKRRESANLQSTVNIDVTLNDPSEQLRTKLEPTPILRYSKSKISRVTELF